MSTSKERIRLSDHFTYKKILRFTTPSMAMMLFISVYGSVDGLFVSNFVGTTAFAALNLIMPFIMVLAALGLMIGAGASAIIGKTLGEEKNQLAKEYFTFFVIATIIAGTICGILGAVFMRPVSVLLGAEGEMVELCVIYGRISMISMPAYMMQNFFQSMFITAEKPEIGFKLTLMAGIINMILDGIFVALLGWGLAGAAWATILGEIFAAIAGLGYFARPNDSILRLVKPRFFKNILGKACVNGSSELISNVAISFIAIVTNMQLIRYAGEYGVAAYGVIMYVSFIFWSLIYGYCIGIAPVISFNFGAKNHKELTNVFIKNMTIMIGSGIGLTIISLVTAYPVCLAFVGYDEQLLKFSVDAYRIYSISYLCMGLGTYASSHFTALNNGVISAIISASRTFLFRLSGILILPSLIGIDGIWLAPGAAEVLSCFIAVYFIISRSKKYQYYAYKGKKPLQ